MLRKPVYFRCPHKLATISVDMKASDKKNAESANTHSARRKLGLSLAGGGFRASLFHLGVLYRMAELDLLRYVEVLSTVSGGSIIGALYTLLLKKYLKEAGVEGNLSRDEYIKLVQELDDTLTRAIQRNLRTLLLLNPIGMLRVMLTEQSLGKRMARIYERHIYNRVVAELEGRSFGWRDYFRFRPGRIKLKDIRPLPGGEKLGTGIEEYNRDAVNEGRSVVTNLILNATTLNSGSRFWFSSYEIGDWNLGHFRHSEIPLLTKRKSYLQNLSIQTIVDKIRETRIERRDLEQSGDLSQTKRELLDRKSREERALSFMLWWRQRSDETSDAAKDAAIPERWSCFFEEVPAFPGRLPDAVLGWLRLLKLPAWYVKVGLPRAISGGRSADEHMRRFWAVMRRIDAGLTYRLQDYVSRNPAARDLLLEFVLELYLVRTAEVVSPRIYKDWDRLTLGEAVGSSACFPPVFPPYSMLGIYDDAYITKLGLTDGGVFDNIGLQALLDERCNYIIASDTSGLFDLQQNASSGRFSMLARIINILMNNVAIRQRDQLRDRRQVSRAITAWPDAPNEVHEFHTLRELRGLSFFHIRSATPAIDGLELAVDRKDIAMLRTDLDSFGDVEIAALVNTGYDSADRYIRKYLSDLNLGEPWDVPDRFPKKLDKSARTDRIIKVGRSNVFRSILLKPQLPLVLIAAALGMYMYLSWDTTFSVAEVVQRINTSTLRWLDESVPFIGGWTEMEISIGQILLAISLAVVGGMLTRGRLIAFIRERNLNLARKIGFVAKWSRSYAGNLLWFFGWFPAILVGIITLLSGLGYVLINLPFLRMTRSRSRSDQ